MSRKILVINGPIKFTWHKGKRKIWSSSLEDIKKM